MVLCKLCVREWRGAEGKTVDDTYFGCLAKGNFSQTLHLSGSNVKTLTKEFSMSVTVGI